MSATAASERAPAGDGRAAPRQLLLAVAGQRLALPAERVLGVQRLLSVDWQGADDEGRPLLLAHGEHGPVVALAAPALLPLAEASPAPRWAVLLRSDDGGTPAAAAVCEVIGLQRRASGVTEGSP